VLTLGLPCTAYELRKDSLGDEVRWAGHLDFVLDPQLAVQLGEPNTEAAVRAALATIAQAAPDISVSLTVAPTQGLGYTLSADPAANQNVIIAVEDWPYAEDALAATIVTVNTRTREIIDADIAFNLEAAPFRVLSAGAGAPMANDVQNTLTHELGHALGLMHNKRDPSVVMWPSAPPGETSKRTLASDDRSGLAVLYATGIVTDAGTTPTTGCSASGAGPLAWLPLLALALLLRRPRLAAGLVALPLAAFAAAPAPALELSRAEQVAVGQVRAMRSERSATQPGLFVTELEVQVNECVRGSCPATVTVRVPGGRLGELEQEVAHHPLPSLADPIAVIRTEGHVKVLALKEPATAQRFSEARLRLLGPSVPAPPARPTTPASQPAAITR
jgi:uncharacterized protein (TIGR03382 family)